MSLPSLDLSLPTDSLHVTAWSDPVIDQLGHDPRSTYAERFWLPILGPSTYLLLRQLAARLDRRPEGFDLPLLDTAHTLGLGTRGGRNAPFIRAIARAVQFKMCRTEGDHTLQVRRHLPPLTRPQINRLAAPLQDSHEAWAKADERVPTPKQQQVRARRLALSLAELGEPDEAIEQQLHRWQLHPAMASDAVRWARARLERADVGAPRSPQGLGAAPSAGRPGQVFDPADDAA